MKKYQRGQALVEYALILALISLVAVAMLRGIGQGVNDRLQDINTNLS